MTKLHLGDEMPSPIVSMVDAACGVTAETRAQWEREKANAPKPPELDVATKRLMAVADAALWWWRMNRPVGWKLAQHRRNPTVNCSGDHEKALAEACACLSLEGWPIQNPAATKHRHD